MKPGKITRRIAQAFLVLCLLMSVAAIAVDAAPPTAYLEGNTQVAPGEEFTVTLRTEQAMCGVDGATVAYDTSILEQVGDVAVSEGWTLLGNQPIRAMGTVESYHVLRLTFRVKEDTAADAFEVRVENVMLLTANYERTESQSLTFRGNIQRPLSSDCSLSSLSIVGIELNNFDPTQFKYYLNAPADMTELDIIAIPSDEKASVKIDKEPLVPGQRALTKITVTAEDGTKAVYTLYVTLSESTEVEIDCSLISLDIPGYDIGFMPDKFIYSLTVDSSVEQLEIDPIPAYENAVATLPEYQLIKGQTTKIQIVVSCEDEGIESMTYTIYVTRKDETNPPPSTSGNESDPESDEPQTKPAQTDAAQQSGKDETDEPSGASSSKGSGGAYIVLNVFFGFLIGMLSIAVIVLALLLMITRRKLNDRKYR